MKSFSAPTLAALSSPHIALAQMVHFAFPSGVIALNSSNWDLTWAGVTYKGAYGLGSISTIADQSGEAQGVRLQLDAGSPSRIALALDAASEVPGTLVTILTAIVSTTTYAVLDAPVDWQGRCDTMSITESGDSATVTVSAESRAVDLLRGAPLTYSNADQIVLFPGDRAFEYVLDQSDKPVVWPAKTFFERP
jgi:hypothetical protein